MVSNRVRAAVGAGAAMAVLSAGAGSAQAAGPIPGTIVRVSTTPAGAAPDSGSSDPSVSADGRYVAFLSDATDVIAGGTSAGQDEGYVRDTTTGTTSLVTRDSNGNPIVGDVADLSISANGRYVVYIAKGPDTPHQPRNPVYTQAYRYDRTTRITRAVSLTPTGGLPYGFVADISISATGRYVVYRSWARNLVPDTPSHPGIRVYRHDFRTGTTTSVPGGGGRYYGGPAVISADGRYAVFEATGVSLRSAHPLLLVDLAQPAAAPVVLDVRLSNGRPSPGPNGVPSISADGTVVTFEHYGNDLVPGMPPHVLDGVYRYVIATHALTRISSVFDRTGAARSTYYGDPTVSADGRFVTYDDRVVSTPVPSGSIVRYDARTGITQVLFAGTSSVTALSADGQHVAFTSSDPSLVRSHDTNNADDVYLWSRS